MKYYMIVNTQVQKIQIKIGVTWYMEQTPRVVGESTELVDLEYQCLDFWGNPAPWLDKILTGNDRVVIEEAIHNHHRELETT